jgi:hypothetical protein
LHPTSPAPVTYLSSPSLAGPKILIRFSLLRLRYGRAAPAPDLPLPLPLLTGLLLPKPPSPPPTTAVARGCLLLLLLLPTAWGELQPVAWGELLSVAWGELLPAWPAYRVFSARESTRSTAQFGLSAASSPPSRLGLPTASFPHPSPLLMSPNGVGPNACPTWSACRLLSARESM